MSGSTAKFRQRDDNINDLRFGDDNCGGGLDGAVLSKYRFGQPLSSRMAPVCHGTNPLAVRHAVVGNNHDQYVEVGF